MFEILLPIKIEVIIRSGREINLSSFFERGSSCSALVFTFIRLTAVNAVSLPDKKKEAKIKKMMANTTSNPPLDYSIFIRYYFLPC